VLSQSSNCVIVTLSGAFNIEGVHDLVNALEVFVKENIDTSQDWGLIMDRSNSEMFIPEAAQSVLNGYILTRQMGLRYRAHVVKSVIHKKLSVDMLVLEEEAIKGQNLKPLDVRYCQTIEDAIKWMRDNKI
jgi:hypothetical protein